MTCNLVRYGKKSDAELHFIIRDAREAAKAQKGMSSEFKYLDQVNDACTILNRRRNAHNTRMDNWFTTT